MYLQAKLQCVLEVMLRLQMATSLIVFLLKEMIIKVTEGGVLTMIEVAKGFIKGSHMVEITIKVEEVTFITTGTLLGGTRIILVYVQNVKSVGRKVTLLYIVGIGMSFLLIIPLTL